MNKLLIIIPAYNESSSIEKTIEEIIALNDICDYVIINDGSQDETESICRRKKYHIINLPVNMGLGAAFRTGMKYAYIHDYQYAMQFDADGQHAGEYIEGMYDHALRSNADITIGSRYIDGNKGKCSLRKIGGQIISSCVKITTGKKIYDVTSGMRLYSKRMIKAFAHNDNFYPEPDTVAYLMRCGAKIEEYPVNMKHRMGGRSYLSIFRGIKYMFEVCASILIMQWFRRTRGVI